MNNKIEELFNTIENTKEYIEYNEIKELLINDEEIMNLIKEIKKLQKKATHEEASHQTIYHETDKLIQEKIINKYHPKYRCELRYSQESYKCKIKVFNIRDIVNINQAFK